jgi:hypothetical protein
MEVKALRCSAVVRYCEFVNWAKYVVSWASPISSELRKLNNVYGDVYGESVSRARERWFV